MKELYAVANECLMEIESLGIEYGHIVDFKANGRANSRWGCCKKRYDGYHIEVHSVLLTDEADIMALKDTLIHEILHTCKNCMNHGSEWKRLAEKMNRAYGYNISRTGSSEEKGVSLPKTKINYKLHCTNCGAVWERSRKSKFVNEPWRYRCHCGGEIERDF